MYRLTDKPIELNELLALVGDPGAGAVATFIGTTRDNNEGRSILSLDYEAYPGMAEQEMARLGEEVEEKWRITRMAMVHRIGNVPIGEASVIIAVSAPHRDDAFKACRYAIDELKKRVPIWKKEIYRGGEIWIGSQTGEQYTTPPAPSPSEGVTAPPGGSYGPSASLRGSYDPSDPLSLRGSYSPSDPLSLWERVGVRVSTASGPFEGPRQLYSMRKMADSGSSSSKRATACSRYSPLLDSTVTFTL